MDVRTEIFNVVQELNEIDDYDNSLSNQLSICDSKISDLMHLIESETLKTNQCYRIVKELKKLRVERRKIKNDMDLLNTYRNNQQKLLNQNNRQMLLAELGKKEKTLNYKYNNRVYTEEEIKELIGV